MKKKLFLFTAITALISITSIKGENGNKITKAETSPAFLVAPKIAKGDEVIFASLGYSTSDFTGGFVMAKDTEKGYTSKAVSFDNKNIPLDSNNIFTVVEGSETDSFAFKLGDQYLRADNSTLKFKEENSDLSATIDPEEASCVLTYPFTFNNSTFDLDITFISDGEDWMINSIFAQNDNGCLIWGEYGSEIDVNGGTFTVNSLTYYPNAGQSIDVPSFTFSYTIDDLTISIPNPEKELETVDKEASWIYEYDKILGVSYVKSCLNNKYLYYDDTAAKFKMSEAQNGIDVFYNTSKNASIHTPISISVNTETLSLEVTQGNAWSWTGIEVTATYAGGAFTTLPIGGFDISTPDTTTAGKKTVKVSLYNLEKTFEITVNEKPAAEIKLKSLSFANYQTQYCIDDEFNYDVDITVHYEGKEDHLLTPEEKEERVTFQIPNLSKKGYGRAVQVGYWEMINGKKQEIKIGSGNSYYVDIVPIDYKLDSITASLKDGVHLYGGEKFSKNNIEVLATLKAEGYDDTTKPVTSFDVTSDFDLSTAMSEGEHEFTVTYVEDGKTVTCVFSATVEHKPVIESYEVTAEDGYVGTTYDVSKNVKVTRVYDTGTKESAENITVDINDLNAIKSSTVTKEQTIRISADGKQIETKTINLTYAPVDSFSLKYESSKDGAKIGDTQQLFIKKVNNEPSLENADWMSTLSTRSEQYLDRFTFTSKNTSIATVDENGFVTYVGNGITEIEVTPKSGEASPFSYSVVVGGPYPSSFTFPSQNVKVKIGEDVTLSCSVLPSNANLSGISWKSSDENIATIDNTGKVHGVSNGDVVITISDSYSGKSANCGVIVRKAFPTTISLDSTIKNILVGEQFSINAKVEPFNDVAQNVTFASNDENIATVDNTGKVIGIGKGTATITVTCAEDNSIQNTVSVVVSEPIVLASSVSLNTNNVSLKVGETSELNVTVNPNNTTDKNVTFVSSDPSVVTVDNSGKITAIKEGQATITVTSVSNSNANATCTVTVVNDGSTNNQEKGCSANVVTFSAIVSTLSLAALLILISKKKLVKNI